MADSEATVLEAIKATTARLQAATNAKSADVDTIRNELAALREKYKSFAKPAKEAAAPAEGEEAISKSEQKRRAKAAEKAAEKGAQPQGEHKPAAAAAADGGEALDDAEDEVDPSKYYEARCAAIEKMKAAGETPYPHKFNVSVSIKNFIRKYESLKNDETHTDKVSVAGRIYTRRLSGKKLIFYDLHGESVKIQVLANASKHTEVVDGVNTFFKTHNRIKRGDIIGVVGHPCKIRGVSSYLGSLCL